MRIVAIEGAGDAISAFDGWRLGQDNTDVTHVHFSGQFFDVCRELDAHAWMISSNPRIDKVTHDKITVEHRGSAYAGKRGLAFHMANVTEAHELIRDAKSFNADVIFMDALPHPFLMRGLSRAGIKMVQVLHNLLWPKYLPRSRASKIIGKLNGPFYRNDCEAVMAVSDAINQQVREVAGDTVPPFVDFWPLFRKDTFEGIPAPQKRNGGFHVMFAGRMEREKGVFDLLEIATELRRRGRDDFRFELCGTGSALDELKSETEERGLSDRFTLHGWCDHATMRDVFSRAAAVVVPTRAEFVEGFNMVVVEALMAGRPVVTSDVCPAVEYVRDAVVVVPPDDVEAYLNAIVELADNTEAYASLASECVRVAERFFDPAFSYRSALRHVLSSLQAGSRPTGVSLLP